jgi:hypothetical protein
VGWQRFTVETLDAISWPLAAVVLAWFFRTNIVQMLHRATRVELPGGRSKGAGSLVVAHDVLSTILREALASIDGRSGPAERLFSAMPLPRLATEAADFGLLAPVEQLWAQTFNRSTRL